MWKQWTEVKQESNGKVKEESEELDWSYMFSSWPCMQMSIEHTHKKNTKKLPATQASVFCYTLQYNLIIGLPFKNADSKIKALLQLRGGLCGWAVNNSKHEKSGPSFSSFNTVTAKIIKKLLWSGLPDEICLIVFFKTLQVHFVYG